MDLREKRSKRLRERKWRVEKHHQEVTRPEQIERSIKLKETAKKTRKRELRDSDARIVMKIGNLSLCACALNIYANPYPVSRTSKALISNGLIALNICKP
ncbi:hypothetical protein AMTR_s00202p00029630 [Amborella trichopoda]|uniref:Uncharacterized protein n=1 Tax=Amborella trichopoda TaxID=13333 RepID=W1NMM6_AMBTC|nr:hypothetical protein AMTR_s00202p00029630 [Amborella trichopoda]